MNETYIKLFRKLKDHDIMRDSTAFHIFIWILISVDYKKGTMISGRFWASSILDIKPRTYHKALQRLEKKYDLVTLTSTNKNTTILVKNWKRYQQDGDTTGDNKVTTKGQQSDTNQEIKEIRSKRIYISIKEIGESHFQKIAEDYSVPISFVRSKYDDMVNWQESTGKIKKDWIATLRNFVKKDAVKIRKDHNDKSKITVARL